MFFCEVCGRLKNLVRDREPLECINPSCSLGMVT